MASAEDLGCVVASGQLDVAGLWGVALVVGWRSSVVQKPILLRLAPLVAASNYLCMKDNVDGGVQGRCAQAKPSPLTQEDWMQLLYNQSNQRHPLVTLKLEPSISA